jgi:hypothetical protein
VAVPNASVIEARARRAGADAARSVRLEWFGDKVLGTLHLNMHQRVALATEHLRSTVVRNISVPVRRFLGPRGGKRVERSVAGEFPRADTTQLMKTIFTVVQDEGTTVAGYVGTPLSYGLILEVTERLDRSFLQRSLNEEHALITKILTSPMS